MASITQPARRAVSVAAVAPAVLLVVLLLLLLTGSEVLGV